MICARHRANRAFRCAIAEQQKYETLTRYGYRWGDFEMNTIAELMEEMFAEMAAVEAPVVVAAAAVAAAAVAAVAVVAVIKTDKTIKTDKIKDLEEGEMEEEEETILEIAEIAEYEGDERPPGIWRPEEHGYCLFCDYQVHTNPPKHFNEQQRKHCCGWCFTSMGRGHGEHCQRCL
jgi:hypothetical protein